MLNLRHQRRRSFPIHTLLSVKPVRKLEELNLDVYWVLTFNLDWRRIATRLHYAAEEYWDKCDVALFEDWEILTGSVS